MKLNYKIKPERRSNTQTRRAPPYNPPHPPHPPLMNKTHPDRSTRGAKKPRTLTPHHRNQYPNIRGTMIGRVDRNYIGKPPSNRGMNKGTN